MSTTSKSLLTFGSILCIVFSCSRLGENEKGQLFLSSRFDFTLTTITGYNFQSAAYVAYPSADEVLPDIIVDQFRVLDGSIEPGFTSPSNTNGFALAGSFTNLEASRDFFEKELISVDSTLRFEASSDTVKRFQVWILKTSLDNYVKLHVLDITEIEDNVGKYNELTIDFYYQSDGSPSFPS